MRLAADGVTSARVIASMTNAGDRYTVLMSWSAPAFAENSTTLMVTNLPWAEGVAYDVQLLDEGRTWRVVDQGHRPAGEGKMVFPIHFTGPGVVLVRMSRFEPPK